MAIKKYEYENILEKKVYIIIPTKKIGGAEKRFCDLWVSFQKNAFFNIKLVITENLFNEFLATDCRDMLLKYRENIKFYSYDGFGYSNWRKSIIQCMDFCNEMSIFHYVLFPPLFWNKKLRKKIVYTYPTSGFRGLLNLKGLCSVGLAFFLSGKNDFLDPSCCKLVRKFFFWKKKTITQTPGSFVLKDIVDEIVFSEKKNWLVFLGRFEKVKQVDRLVDFIPDISRELIKNGVQNYKFFILGYGSQRERIISKIKDNILFRGINIEVFFAPHPEEILKFSKIIFSLQLYNNYPSRSLIEAMLYGNIPIATDVGDSRKIVKKEFGHLIPRTFSSKDIARECTSVLRLDEESYMQKVHAAQKFVKENHSVERSMNYFLELYEVNGANEKFG